jgi:hypothetical protein
MAILELAVGPVEIRRSAVPYDLGTCGNVSSVLLPLVPPDIWVVSLIWTSVGSKATAIAAAVAHSNTWNISFYDAFYINILIKKI